MGIIIIPLLKMKKLKHRNFSNKPKVTQPIRSRYLNPETPASVLMLLTTPINHVQFLLCAHTFPSCFQSERGGDAHPYGTIRKQCEIMCAPILHYVYRLLISIDAYRKGDQWEIFCQFGLEIALNK